MADSKLVLRRPPDVVRSQRSLKVVSLRARTPPLPSSNGDEIEAVVALELEPADVVGAPAAGNEIVFQVVADRGGLGIDGVGTEIGGVTFKGGRFFFGCGGEHAFCIGREGFAIGFEDDVDAHVSRGIVHEQAGGPVINERATGRVAFDGNESPSADKLLR